jgi:hypothetical protein
MEDAGGGPSIAVFFGGLAGEDVPRMGVKGHMGLTCDALLRSLLISPISQIGPIRGTSLE